MKFYIERYRSLDHCHLHNATQVFVPSAVLLASFLGSGHCIAMCGGLIAAGAKSTLNICIYHFGRLLSYLMLGLLFGAIGEKAQIYFTGTASWMVAILMGLSFIFLGIYSWKGGAHPPLPATIQNLITTFSGKLLRQSAKSGANIYAGLLGAFSIFLPCGWLYSFALASASTQNPLSGAGAMFFFWVGTLPALTIVPLLFQKFLGPLRKWTPQISALLLIVIGIATILAKFLH
jgi:sulfite exporter TauE/SafE